MGTWNYSTDGGAGPGHAGDDDESESLVLEAGHRHVIGIALPVPFCNIRNRFKFDECGSCGSGLCDPDSDPV